jgi:dihydroorotate dehydrogenase (fumarate)
MPNLSTTYLGLKLKNPIVAASSGLTDSVENIKSLEKAGVSAVVLKSIFEEEIVSEMEINMKKMATESFLYPETLEFYEDHEEEKNISTKYLELIKEAKQAVDIPVIASINCITSDYWTYFPKMVEEAGADAIELNIFILPSDLNRNKAVNEQVYFDIISKVKKQVKIPVSVKISYYFSDLARFIQKLSSAGVEGIVLFNRFYNPDFDIEKMEVVSGSVLSSPEDFHIPLRWISLMSGRVKCSLAASTGIHDGTAIVKQILAGADVVEIASTIYQNGYERVGEMLEFVQKWMDTKGYESLVEYKGKMNQKDSERPAAYERVQFMRYFRGYQNPLEN